jgi:hypothetical protein
MALGLPETSTRLEGPSGSAAHCWVLRDRAAESPRKTSPRTLKTAQLANASGFHRSVRCLSRHRMELITVKI